MSKVMTIDRVPEKFCEGPFWGNGTIGTVMFVKNGNLCLSMDHSGLWELRETLPDEPKADFGTILAHKEEYLDGDPNFVEDTNIFDRAIGRTRLPALEVCLGMPDKVSSFLSKTDLERAKTRLEIGFSGAPDGRENGGERSKNAGESAGNAARTLTGTIYIDSNVNVLYLELEGEEAERLQIKTPGWDLDSPALAVLKRWGYQPCLQSGDAVSGRPGVTSCVVRQRFGRAMSAVLCAAMERSGEKLRMAVSMEVCGEAGEKAAVTAGQALSLSYLDHKAMYSKAHEDDWTSFWSGFAIRIPDTYLQNAVDIEMYKLYCNERENGSPITLQGIWNAPDRMPAWTGDLHNDLNVQSCYWPAYLTGNVRIVRPYVDTYCRAVPRLMEHTKKLFGMDDAIQIPTMMTPEGTGAASEWCYWNTILGPELFVAVDFTWFYEFSGETDTLENKIYPFVEKVLHLYQGIAFRKKDGYLHIPFTQSPEVDRDGHMLMKDDATFTLSSLHYLCRKMEGYALKLGLDDSSFKDFDEKLAPVVTDESGYTLFAGQDVFKSHRHFGQLFPIFPLCEEAHSDLANRSLDTAINQGFLAYAAFSFPYLGIFAARCGRGNMCRTMLDIYCRVFRSRNTFTVNGDPYQNGVISVMDTNAGEPSDSFTLESGFFVPTLLCQMFVHRAADTVYLLEGMPDEWKEADCRGITVLGGHRFDIEMRNYHLSRVVCRAQKEETLTFTWKESERLEKVQVIRRGAGQAADAPEGGSGAAGGTILFQSPQKVTARVRDGEEIEFIFAE